MSGVRLLVLLGLCACNQVFGLHETGVFDAAFFDAHLDAPFSCPPIGTTPTFDTTVTHPVPVPNDCSDYVPSEVGTAMALCSNQSTIMFGPASGPLEVAMLDHSQFGGVAGVRLAPEGNLAIVVGGSGNFMPRVAVYTLDSASQLWSYVADVPGLVANQQFFASTPTRGPDRHVLLLSFEGNAITELVGDLGTWQPVASYTTADFGLASSDSDIDLSPDGLRVVAQGTTADTTAVVSYLDRPTIDMRLGASTMLALPAQSNTPYLAEDCSSIYFETQRGGAEVFFEQ